MGAAEVDLVQRVAHQLATQPRFLVAREFFIQMR
jgi:hypothetical protein